jgi:hypothetical protein
MFHALRAFPVIVGHWMVPSRPVLELALESVLCLFRGEWVFFFKRRFRSSGKGIPLLIPRGSFGPPRVTPCILFFKWILLLAERAPPLVPWRFSRSHHVGILIIPRTHAPDVRFPLLV